MNVENTILSHNYENDSTVFSPSTKSSYDIYGIEYDQTAVKLLYQGKIDEYLAVTLKFLEDHPCERRYALKAFNVLQLNYGSSKVFRKVVNAIVTASQRVLSVGMDRFGLPPCFEEYWAFNRIGELVEQTAFAHLMHKLKPNHQKPLIRIENFFHFPFPAFVVYLSEGFEMITDLNETNHIRKVEALAPYSTFFYQYSDTKYGHNKTFYGDIYPDLVQKELNVPTFKLRDNTYEVARSFLKDYDLSDTDDFVLLHLRESGFILNDNLNRFMIGKQPDYQRFRNVNPLDYLEAIDFILSLGLKVVRIGNPLMTPLPDKKGLIDLALITHPSEVDIYLSARAKFYYGSLSGPFSLFRHFNSGEALITNSIDYGLSIPNCFVQMLPMQDQASGNIVSMKEIEKLDLFGVCAATPFTRKNLKPIFPTSEDHLRSVKDMIEYIDGGDIFRLNNEAKIVTGREDMLSCFDSESLKLLQS